MNEFQKNVLNLVNCALSGETPKSCVTDYDSIYKFAKKQQIIALLFYPLSKLEEFKKSEIYAKFFGAYMVCLQVSENQTYETEKLFFDFDKENVSYVKLKGTILKGLYPKPEMRTMGDADILIKPEQYEEIEKIMKSRGFVYKYESNHELVWQKGNSLLIELHKMLIPSYNSDYYEYFGDGWKLVKNNEMSNEDAFVFMFTHFAKHYRDGGVGLRYLIDFKVYFDAHKDLDFDYIERELEKLRLAEFYKNVLDVAAVWFDGKETTEKTDFITDYLFDSGVYGTEKNHAKSEGVKISKETKNVKGRKVLRLLFPTYSAMKERYKVLKKAPILLPVMYIYRYFDVLFNRRKNITKNLNELKYYSDENVSSYRKALNYVGLDFNFGEEAATEPQAKKGGKE